MKARLIKCRTGFGGHAFQKFVRIRVRRKSHIRVDVRNWLVSDIMSMSVRLWCTRRIVFGVNGNGNWKNSNVPYDMDHIKILILERWFRFWSFIRFENTFLYHKHASQWPNNPNALKYYFTFFEKVDSGKKIPSWWKVHLVTKRTLKKWNWLASFKSLQIQCILFIN